MKPVPLQDAATVVLLRDGPDGLEVLMGRRSRSTRFSAGAWVFPGGAVDPGDSRAIPHCRGLKGSEADRLFGEEQALSYYLAAARELFEEAGLWLFSGPRPADWDGLRRALHRDESRLHELLEARQASLDCTGLHYFRFWTTPPGMPRRYRTRFFLARAPQDQAVEVDGVELTEHCWTSPAQMLQRQADGEVDLIFPTQKELQALDAHDSVAAALAAQRQLQEVPEIRTRHLFENGRFVRVLMPGEPGYEDLPAW